MTSVPNGVLLDTGGLSRKHGPTLVQLQCAAQIVPIEQSVQHNVLALQSRVPQRLSLNMQQPTSDAANILQLHSTRRNSQTEIRDGACRALAFVHWPEWEHSWRISTESNASPIKTP